MIQVFRIFAGVALAAVLIFSKWRMLKKLWSKDLGDGEIQTLFDKDSSSPPPPTLRALRKVHTSVACLQQQCPRQGVLEFLQSSLGVTGSTMRRTRFFTALLTFVSFTAFLCADCTKDQDHRSSKNAGFLITDFTISGTQTLSSDELATITNELIGSCFDENSEELEERVQALFKNRGYLIMQVKSFRVKPVDPIGVPKPAMLEADVLEGPRFRLAEVNFTGNHAFTADELRSKFLLKEGDLLARDKIAGGLDDLRQLYVSHGFLDLTTIPEVQIPSDGTAILSISILEGVQYHMGKLGIFAKKEAAESLLSKWELPEGAVFDRTYLDKYIGSNRSLLPPEFQREHVQIVRDCPDATVDVRLPLDAMDPRSQSLPKDSECGSPDNSSK